MTDHPSHMQEPSGDAGDKLTPMPPGAPPRADFEARLKELALAAEQNFTHIDGQMRSLVQDFNQLALDFQEYTNEQDLLVVETHSHGAGDSEGGTVLHDDLGGVTSDQHHLRLHAIDDLALDHAAATDNTNHDVSTSKHGFVPKAPGGTTSFLRADVTWAVPSGGGGGGGGGLYATDIGDGHSVDFDVTHGLATQDLVVQVYDKSTLVQVECDIIHVSATVLRISFTYAPGTNAFRVVVVGGVAAGGGVVQSYIGYDTIGGTLETMTTRRVYAKKVTVATAGLLTGIEAYVDAGGADDSVGSIRVALFSDNAGTPNQVLSQASSSGESAFENLLLDTINGAGGNTTPRWLGGSIGYWLTPGDYWLAVQHLRDSGGIFRIRYDATGSDRFYTAGGQWIADWGWYTPTTSANQYSIRGNVVR